MAFIIGARSVDGGVAQEGGRQAGREVGGRGEAKGKEEGGRTLKYLIWPPLEKPTLAPCELNGLKNK